MLNMTKLEREIMDSIETVRQVVYDDPTGWENVYYRNEWIGQIYLNDDDAYETDADCAVHESKWSAIRHLVNIFDSNS